MNKGFTLIELLVVIAIIGLLSSIVLASLQSARNKGKESAIKSAVLEMRTLYELEYLATGSYANLNKGSWLSTEAACTSAGFAGSYASQFIALCKQVVINTSAFSGSDSHNLSVNASGGGNYSIMVNLDSGMHLCYGNSGRNSSGPWDPSFLRAGCINNP